MQQAEDSTTIDKIKEFTNNTNSSSSKSASNVIDNLDGSGGEGKNESESQIVVGGGGKTCGEDEYYVSVSPDLLTRRTHAKQQQHLK